MNFEQCKALALGALNACKCGADLADWHDDFSGVIRAALQGSSQPDPRIAEFFKEIPIGHGDDPIGFLIASHRGMAQQRNEALVRVDGLVKALQGVSHLARRDEKAYSAHMRGIIC